MTQDPVDPTTRIIAVPRRPYGYDAYLDLHPVPPLNITETPGGRLAVTFAGVLAPAVVAAIRGRITSTDDDDQAARLTLRAAFIDYRTTPTAATLAKLVTALVRAHLIDETP